MSTMPVEPQRKCTVSRRDFFRLAMGTMFALPTVAGGYIVPATVANGATLQKSEEDGGDTDDGTTTITMVSASQVGIVVADTSDGGYSKVPNATISLYSRYNGEKLTTTTAKNGEAIFDIRNLAENPEDKKLDELESYEFNASITVTCAGYREFEVPLTRVRGGEGMLVPVRTMTDGMPYPRKVTLNEWDVLYTKNVFGAMPSNTDNQTLCMEFRQLKDVATTVTLKLDKDQSTILTTKGTPQGGTLEVSFKGAYLHLGNEACFPITGDEKYLNSDAALDPNDSAFVIELKQGDLTYSWPIHLMVYETSIEPVNKGGESLKPFNGLKTAVTGLNLAWPSNVPLVGGGSIKTLMPDLAVNVNLNPWGMFQFTAKTPQWGYVKDSGKRDELGEVKPGEWGSIPRSTLIGSLTKTLENAQKGVREAKQAYTKNGAGIIRPLQPVYKISATGSFQILAIAQWDTQKHLFRGMAALQLLISFNASYGWNFFLGPVPILIVIAFESSLLISVQAAMYTISAPTKVASEVATDVGAWHFDYSNTGLIFTVSLMPSLTVGIGIRGVASIAAKGNFTLTLMMGLVPPIDLAGKDREFPHLIAGYGAEIILILDMFLYTTTFRLGELKYRDFYDNWKGGLQSQADETLAAMGLESVEDLFDSLTMITDTMLESTEEFSGLYDSSDGTDGAALTASNDATTELGDAPATEGTFDWESMREADVEGTLDNGKVITYAVYRIAPDDELEDAQDEDADAAQDGAADATDTTGDAATQESATEDTTAPEDAADDAVQVEADAETAQQDTADEGAGGVDAAADTSTAAGLTGASTLGAQVLAADGDQVLSIPAEAASAGLTVTVQERTAAATAQTGTGDEPAIVSTDEAASAGADEVATEAASNEGAAVAAEADQPADAVQDGTADTDAAKAESEAAKDAAAQKATKKGVLRRRCSRNTFERTQGGFAAMADGDNTIRMTPGAQQLGVNGGVRPSSDKIIASRVFGDPRIKIVHMHTEAHGVYLSATCAFRLGSVSINGQMRTRVIMTVIDGQSSTFDQSELIGYSRPLDFEINDIEGISHDDLYDYDFDIAFTTTGKADMVHLVVVSGKRGTDEGDTTFAEAATDLVFSYINFHVYEAVGGRIAYLTKSIPASETMGTAEGFHVVSNVTCATDGTDESNTLLIAYLDTYADSPEDALSGDAELATTTVSFAIVDQAAGTWIVPNREELEDALGTIDNGLIFEMSLSSRVSGAYTLTLTATSESYFYVVRLDEATMTFTSIKMAAVLEDSMRLIPWKGQDCFLTSYPSASYLEEINANDLWKKPNEWDRSKWILQKAVWNEADDGTPILDFTPVGPSSFNIRNFGVNNAGTFIFWPQSREKGDGRVYDENANYESLESGDIYQLMACRMRNGSFSDSFVAADVPHDLDSLAIITSRDNEAPLEVLSTEKLDTGEVDSRGEAIYHAVNVWYTAIPHLKSVVAIGCSAPVPFVAPGGKIMFHVSLRNFGNCYLSGCTVQLCVHEVTEEKDGSVESDVGTRVEGSVADIVFGEDTIVESHYNPVEDGEIQNVEPDFALGPGKISIYKVFVSVPKDWTGSKRVSFVASNAVVAEGGGLMGSADDEVVYKEYYAEPGEYQPMRHDATPSYDSKRRYMNTITVEEAVAKGDDIADAPLSIWTAGDAIELEEGGGASLGGTSGGNAGATSGGNQKLAGTGARRTPLPDTADPFSTAVVAGLATAGAALAAYGRRRAANEADKDEDTGEDA